MAKAQHPKPWKGSRVDRRWSPSLYIPSKTKAMELETAMTKPDWCPEDVWQETAMLFDALYDAEPELEGGCEQSIREMAAKLALSERDKQCEKDAVIAETPSTYDADNAYACRASIASAIRSNKTGE